MKTGARQHHWMPSPLGRLEMTAEGEQLVRLTWRPAAAADNPGRPPSPLLAETQSQLEAYFAGRLRAFDLPLAPQVGAHDQRVLDAMLRIPYAETRTYGELALEAETNARALGGACGRNPIPLVIPCHRVVGKGHMGGFSAPRGRQDKRWLLTHEAAYAGGLTSPAASGQLALPFAAAET